MPDQINDFNHVMVDLETLATSPNAVILSIGAVRFNPYIVTQVIDLDNCFYRVIDIGSSIMTGMEISPETIKWWQKQSNEAQSDVFLAESVHISNALASFSSWLPTEDFTIWGNGSSFDIPILENAYRKTKITNPWKYSSHRDYRTIKMLYERLKKDKNYFPEKMNGTAHNALDDARHQVTCLQHMMSTLGFKPENFEPIKGI